MTATVPMTFSDNQRAATGGMGVCEEFPFFVSTSISLSIPKTLGPARRVRGLRFSSRKIF